MAGSLRIQSPNEMFSQWADCEKLAKTTEPREDNPRHFRAMINCVLYQGSKGNELCIVTEDEELISFAADWDLKVTSISEMESASSSALARYHKDMKAYEARKSRTARNNPQSLWTPK